MGKEMFFCETYLDAVVLMACFKKDKTETALWVDEYSVGPERWVVVINKITKPWLHSKPKRKKRGAK